MKQTQVGLFSTGSDYRNHLKSLGYTDLGWINGWTIEEDRKWADSKLLGYVEHTQWNNSGSDVTYAIHSAKIFCSVDMGD